jgi:ribosomal protein S27AE
MSNTQRDCTKCGAILTQHILKVLCGSSCLECGRYAYFADQPSYLYLLTNQQLKLHKIGIGSVGKDKDRLQQLVESGWSVHGLWHESSERKTFQWEQEVFKQLKIKLSLTRSETPDLMGRRDRSWSESVSADAISVSEITKLITKIILRN